MSQREADSSLEASSPSPNGSTGGRSQAKKCNPSLASSVSSTEAASTGTQNEAIGLSDLESQVELEELDLIHRRSHKHHSASRPTFGRIHLVEEMEAIADVDRALEIEEIRDSVLGRPHSRSQSLHHVKLVLDSEEESEVPTEEGGTRTKSDEIASERDPNAKPDILGAIFNLMNYALGAGILALPYAFRQAGVVLGTSLVLIVAVATIFGMFLLLESSRVTKAYGYEQLARISYGDKFAQFVKICIIVDSFGALSAYMIVVAETTTDVMKGYLGPHTIWGNKFLVLFLVATFIMLPLCCLKNINYLGFTSALSLVPLVYLLVLQLYYLIKAGGVQPGVALFNSRFFFSLPIIVFSFSSQQALFPLYTELQERNGTESHIRKVVVWSLVLTAICYLFSGFVGVFTYPTSAKGNVLNNFPEGVLVDVLLITTAVSIVLSFPVILWPARVSTDRLFFLDKPESYLRFILEAVGILALAFLIAVAVPSFSTVLGLFGSLTNTTIGYVLPPLYFLKLDPRMLKTSRVKQAAVALLVIGSLAGLISAGIITEDYISSLINRKPAEGQ